MASDNQIAALKYMIFHSREIGDTCKRVLATLLEESQGLKSPVKIRFEANMQGYSEDDLRQLCRDFSIATSGGCKTHLHELLAIAGCNLQFSHAGSLIDYQCGLWPTNGKKEPRVVEVTRSKLNKIDLSRPGLYPSLEEQDLQRRA